MEPSNQSSINSKKINKQTKNGPKIYLQLTYRSHIKSLLPTTYYETDSGWGCVLRVTQMFVANYLLHYQSEPPLEVIKLFLDNSAQAPFSIQMFTHSSQNLFPQKKKYDWYTPSQAGAIIQDLLPKYLSEVSVSICNDNTLFKSQIITTGKECVVLLMTRIGLDSPQQEYIPIIKDFMLNKFFAGIIGGTPKRAHFFVQHCSNRLCYLDPHKRYKCINTKAELNQKWEEEYLGKLESIQEKYIDPSMCICFNFRSQLVEQFWQSILSLKAKYQDNFFLYVDLKPPEFNEDDIVIIDSDDA